MGMGCPFPEVSPGLLSKCSDPLCLPSSLPRDTSGTHLCLLSPPARGGWQCPDPHPQPLTSSWLYFVLAAPALSNETSQGRRRAAFGWQKLHHPLAPGLHGHKHTQQEGAEACSQQCPSQGRAHIPSRGQLPCSIPHNNHNSPARTAPLAAPTSLSTWQPCVTPLLLVNQPRMCLDLGISAGLDSASHSSLGKPQAPGRWQGLAQLPQPPDFHPSTCCLLQTRLNGSALALPWHCPDPQSQELCSACELSQAKELRTAPRARRLCTETVTALWDYSSSLGKAEVCHSSLLRMRGQRRQPFGKPWPTDKAIPVAPGPSWLLAFHGTDSVPGAGAAAQIPAPLSVGEGAAKPPLWTRASHCAPSSSPSCCSPWGVLEAPTFVSLQIGDMGEASEASPRLRSVACCRQSCLHCTHSCLHCTHNRAQEPAEPWQRCQLWPPTGGAGSGGGFQPQGHSQRKDL